MLTVTPSAAEAVRQLVSASPVDEQGGVRISAGESTPEGTALRLSLVDSPDSADAAVEASGARIFVEPAVAPFLDDKVLDVEVDEGRPSFALRPQGDQPLDGNSPAAH